MYLTGLVQRDRLFELATRWLGGRAEPGDGRFVTQVFIYENVISAPSVRRFIGAIVESLRRAPVRMRHFYDKDEVREAIIDSCARPQRRVAELFDQYRRHPEEFFPHTPVDLVMASREDGALIAMARLKRIRRIADKVSRRVADCLADEITTVARSLAGERAKRAGMSLNRLVSSPELMVDEFAAAERAVAHTFKGGGIVLEPDHVRIDDVIGSKFVGAPDELDRIEQAIRAYPHAMAVDREVHRGVYNDVNLVVDLELPPSDAIIDRARERDWSYLERRGLDAETLRRGFPEYVESGARTFRLEVILTTFDELVESEFGRSIHEARVARQRDGSSYSGRIAQNASFIIEFLLKLAISPSLDVSELPVKMWGRYLPDTLAQAIARLSGNESVERLFDSFAPEPREQRRLSRRGEVGVGGGRLRAI